MRLKITAKSLRYIGSIRRIYFVGLIFFGVISVFIVSSSFAQTPPAQGIDITVSPPVIELNAKPGDKIKERFRVRNNQSDPLNLEITVQKLSGDPNSGEPVPTEGSPGDEFISWLKADSANFTVLPSEWKDVNFTIDIPENAAYGYYYVLRIAQASNPSLNTSGAKVKGEILIVVLLNVKKEGAQARGEIVEFKPNRFIGEYLPVDFTAKVANKGNVHIRPHGNIFIRSFGQKDTAILDINPGQLSVLPDGTRTFSSEWTDGFIVREPVMDGEKVKLDNKGNPVTKLTFNWNRLTNFRVGKYTATLLMVYDDGQRDATIEGTAVFWLIPYTALAVIAIGLVATILLIRFFLKWYIRRELKKHRTR